ncbi:hypothetical protein [Clostridium thermarum]|uniref:hypothetical protein n=1 Tax=Clostridium thermarum TaxID=1716543 RepID=UPI0013CFD0B4|nr:hypothetical protein [Clostridium thermarum]
MELRMDEKMDKNGDWLKWGLVGRIMIKINLHGEKCLFDVYIVRIKKKGSRNKKKTEKKLSS